MVRGGAEWGKRGQAHERGMGDCGSGLRWVCDGDETVAGSREHVWDQPPFEKTSSGR